MNTKNDFLPPADNAPGQGAFLGAGIVMPESTPTLQPFPGIIGNKGYVKRTVQSNGNGL